MKDPKKFQAAKKRMRKHLQNIIRTHEELIANIADWNENRLDERPFDSGGDRVIVKMAKEILQLVEAERSVPQAMVLKLSRQVLANARK